jgi:hypothetical protein
MSFEIPHGLFGLGQQLIKPGRPLSAATAIDPFSISLSESFIHGPVHTPEVFDAKSHAQGVFVGTIQAIMQELPISQVHKLF